MPRQQRSPASPRSLTLVLALLVFAVAEGALAAGAHTPTALRLRSVTLPAGGDLPDVPAHLAAPPLGAGGAALVQFTPASTPAQRRHAVAAVGARYGAYVPDDGAMVLLPPAEAAALAARPEVVRVLGLAPAWKLAPWLAREAL